MLRDYVDAYKGLSRNTLLALMTWSILALVYLGIFAVVFNLYLLRLGLRPDQIGLVASVHPLTGALVSLPAGILGRKRGSRTGIILGAGLLAAGQVLIPFAELLSPPFWIPWFLGCQIFAGSGGSIFMVNHVAYLSGSTNRKGRSYAFSLREATAPFAGFIGSLLGGILPSVFSRLTAVGMDNPVPTGGQF